MSEHETGENCAIEFLEKVIGCDDCRTTSVGYCPLCKKQARKWSRVAGKIRKAHKKEIAERQLPWFINRITVPAMDFLKNKFPDAPQSKPVKKPKLKRVLRQNIPEQPEPVTIDNFFIRTRGYFREIDEVPNGFKLFTSTKGSEYFTDECKSILIRRSDHWGSHIGFCSWYIIGMEKKPCWRWKSGIKTGLISFDNLHINEEHLVLYEPIK